jgi:hypothetical protein
MHHCDCLFVRLNVRNFFIEVTVHVWILLIFGLFGVSGFYLIEVHSRLISEQLIRKNVEGSSHILKCSTTDRVSYCGSKHSREGGVFSYYAAVQL